jgi:glycosyltransferase involved in cell wall biosynthesis
MPLHIGFFQSGYPVPDGTTTAVRGLSFALTRQGHRATIYGCGTAEDSENISSDRGLQVLLFPKRSRNPFSVPPRLLRKLAGNEDKLDLLVINLMFNPPNVAVARAARKGGIPYVVSPHDPYHPELLKKNRLRKLFYAAVFERPLLRKAAAVQLLAENHEPHLRNFGFAGPVLVIPNGFDPSSSALSGHSSDHRLSGFPRFLSIGRLDMHHKGLDLLIEGFASALRSGVLPCSASLTFLGPDEGDLQKLRKIASRQGVAAHVSFAGRVSDTIRSCMLRNCDLLLLCSRYDGFGLAALEAMLAARPLIVSREAGISGWIEKAGCGILVEPSPASICSGFAGAMKLRSQWDEMGARGQSFARQNMTWGQLGSHAIECYLSLMEIIKKEPSTI